MSLDNILIELQKDFGNKAFKASEAPLVRVISTGVTTLDVATGIGGFPRGTLVEVYGRESSGKTALMLYAMAEAHKNNGFTGLVNLESGITKEGWLDWAVSIAPSYFDPARVLIVNPNPGTEALLAFGKMIASGAFDVIGYDSIGAMSTDKELKIGEAKQAYGQSALVTQLIKQAAHYAYDKQCVPIMLNQIRDDAAGQYVVEKAPGGRAKDHFATLRVHLKSSPADFKKTMGAGAIVKIDGEDVVAGFRVNATIVKNKVGAPRRKAGWNYWNYPSPAGVLGIDTFQATVDAALQSGLFEKAGAWYRYESFPDGKLNGGVKVTEFLRENPNVMETVRRELVMKAYNERGNVMETDREVLTDAVV
jgi:recombination protein RecA